MVDTSAKELQGRVRRAMGDSIYTCFHWRNTPWLSGLQIQASVQVKRQGMHLYVLTAQESTAYT